MRYQIDRRVGIVAVVDTEHVDYGKISGLSESHPCVVASWHGVWTNDTWKLYPWQVQQAHRLRSFLNNSIANNELLQEYIDVDKEEAK